jgi:hypothetical protein
MSAAFHLNLSYILQSLHIPFEVFTLVKLYFSKRSFLRPQVLLSWSYPLVVGDVAKLEEAGISVDPRAVKVNFEKVMERVRRIRAAISHNDSADRFTKELGVHVYIGRGKFSGPKSIVVNGQTLTFKRAVIATGTCTFSFAGPILLSLKTSFIELNSIGRWMSLSNTHARTEGALCKDWTRRPFGNDERNIF